jgi:hypothetical protein
MGGRDLRPHPEYDRKLALLCHSLDGGVFFVPVSRAVNNVRSHGPQLPDRIDDPAAPPPSDAPAGANSE